MGDPARKPPLEDDASDPLDHGDEWEQEIDRRIEDVRSERVRGISHEQMMAKLRAKYGWT